MNTTRCFSFRPKVTFTTKVEDKPITATTLKAKRRLKDSLVDDDGSAESSSAEDNGEDKAKSLNGANGANGDKQSKTVESNPFAWVG